MFSAFRLKKFFNASNNKEKAKRMMVRETANEQTIVDLTYPYVCCSSGPIEE